MIVTSRRRRGWRNIDRLHEVGPLDGQDAAELFARLCQKSGSGSLVPSATGGLPSLVRLAGALAHDVPLDRLRAVSSPEGLVELALLGCTSQELTLLEVLAARPSRAPFTILTVRPVDVGNAVSGLVRRGLVQRLRDTDEMFLLSAPARQTMRGRMGYRERPEPAGTAARIVDDAASLLDGRPRVLSDDKPPDVLAPRVFAAHLDEFLRLAADVRQQRKHPLDELFSSALATVLAFLGDAHRLVGLYRSSRDHPAVRRALCALAREVGLPDVAQLLVEGDPGPEAAHESAANHHAAGRLDTALTDLGTAPAAEDIHSAWHHLVRGAVLCDQGKVDEAARHLRFSADLHRAFDCRRGHGQALLHLARVDLLRGLDAAAEELLAEADELFDALGDIRGQNWVETERVRLRTRSGAVDAALHTARGAFAAHEAAGDTRGMAWTLFWLGHAHEAAGRPQEARSQWTTAGVLFSQCQDALGEAWTMHRKALGPTGTPGGGSLDQWLEVQRAFLATGCPHGRAWTNLEIAARIPGKEMSSAFASMASADFDLLDDLTGQAWRSALLVVRGGPPGPDDYDRIAGLLPARVPRASELIAAIGAFMESGVATGIPPAARDLVLTHHTPVRTDSLPGTPGHPRCRVRITLLDDSPAADTTARLLLRVSPEPGHPWAAGLRSAPWLTATALPLTRASLEPPSALLRPSQEQAHGAEFDFTPHRTGTHRLRFTIALERTGTVLQQVETELDILDSDRPGSHAAPHAAIPRGR